MSGAGLRISWLDVFTDRPLAGNPLAVVPDADGLDDARMQAIAAELGLSETVFVTGGAGRLRIFTPTTELPLAGHPVVGVSLELARLGRISSEGTHVFRTGVGDTLVSLSGGEATMTQAAFDPGHQLDADELAIVLGIEAGAVVGAPRVCSTSGMRQAFVRIRDRQMLRALQPDLGAVGGFTDADAVGVWCDHGDELALRFFGPRVGVPEDPATGSACGALGALRVFEGGEPGAVTIRQGDELGRPSEIHVTIGGSPRAPEDVRVGGRAVLVMEGTLSAALVAG
jgi:trans-2,3-dihydro-3-hydroxyanthranilate isomerase